MTDPITLLVVLTCLQGVSRLVDTLGQWLILRARANLARVEAVPHHAVGQHLEMPVRRPIPAPADEEGR